MKYNLYVYLIIILFSCKSTVDETPIKYDTPLVDMANLLVDYKSWWSYHYNEISLTQDFIPLNEQGASLSKEQFYDQIMKGNYVVVEMKSSETQPVYRLYQIPDDAPKSVVETMKNTTATILKHYRMEGNPFPEIDLEDIAGNRYTTDKLKGKTTVIKTWFIACKPCVAEFPELNKLVDGYRENDNIQFLSLALDKQSSLKKFLKRKPFSYPVVAEQRDLIEKELNLFAYPTHLIVDEKGEIIKVVNKVSELTKALEVMVD